MVLDLYQSMVQRKVLAPNNFDDPLEVGQRLLEFEVSCERVAKHFVWKSPGMTSHTFSRNHRIVLSNRSDKLHKTFIQEYVTVIKIRALRNSPHGLIAYMSG